MGMAMKNLLLSMLFLFNIDANCQDINVLERRKLEIETKINALKDSLSDITQRVENTHVLLLKDIKITHEFFENETINPEFFETGKSSLIIKHQLICEKIDRSLNELDVLQKKNNFELSDTIKNLTKDFFRV